MLSSRMAAISSSMRPCGGSPIRARWGSGWAPSREWLNTGFSSGSPMPRLSPGLKAGALSSGADTRRKDRPMKHLRLAAALLFACTTFGGAVLAQPAPSASAVATARELVETKGGAAMFDPVIVSVVEQTKAALLQTNPQLSKDLNDVAAQLRTEFTPKRDELMAQAAKLYADRFSEQELKEMLTFYKSALGKKMVNVEPQVLDETFNYVQQWGARVSEDVMNRFRAEMKKKGHNL